MHDASAGTGDLGYFEEDTEFYSRLRYKNNIGAWSFLYQYYMCEGSSVLSDDVPRHELFPSHYLQSNSVSSV